VGQLLDATDREWLEASLAELIASEGPEPFLAAPLLSLVDDFLPEEWAVDPAGVRYLTRGLLSQVGLEAEVVLDLEEPAPGGFAFLGADPVTGTLRFAVEPGELDKLDESDLLIPWIAREVTRAWRLLRELPESPDDEELLDVTEVYLGFGIYAVNASYSYRASGGLEGTMAVTRWSHAQSGALSPQEASYLLALLAVGRGLDEDARKAIAAQLETNQASYFASHCGWLERNPDSVARLKLPPRETWPAPRKVRVADGAPAAQAGGDPSWSEPPPNLGRPVFRFPKHASPAPRLLLTGALVGVTMIVSVAAGLSPGGSALVAAGAFVAAMVLPKRRVTWHCASVGCEEPLTPTMSVCPGCGGTISGDISDRNKRLEAEEQLAEESDTSKPPYR
jgi:hypothetical protein